MDITKLSSANQTILTNKQKTEENIQASPEQKKNGKKLLALSVATIATVVVATLAIKKKSTKTLSDIDFNKGIATLKKNGKNFSGKIKTKLPNGDKVTMNYADGILQSSIRIGSENTSKTFSTNEKGEKIVEIIKNRKSETKNISVISELVKKEQNELKELLSNNKKLSFEEFKNKTEQFKYVNKNQKNEIANILKQKLDYEASIKAEALKRISDEKNTQKIANYNQLLISKSINNNLSNKSAQESASIIEELKQQEFKAEISAEAQQRIAQQNAIKLAQEKENKYFESLKTPSKFAQESALTIDELKKQEAQSLYNKPFKEMLSNKNAQESAQVFIVEEFKNKGHISISELEKIKHILEDDDDIEEIQDFALQIANSRRLNAFNPAYYGFSTEGKLHEFPDGTSAIVHEGPGLLDVTSDGRLLIKVYADWYLELITKEQPESKDIKNACNIAKNYGYNQHRTAQSQGIQMEYA